MEENIYEEGTMVQVVGGGGESRFVHQKKSVMIAKRLTPSLKPHSSMEGTYPPSYHPPYGTLARLSFQINHRTVSYSSLATQQAFFSD